MLYAVNSHARQIDGRKEYPTMYGADGWYGWRDTPWDVAALELWYWSQAQRDQERVADNAWVRFLHGQCARCVPRNSSPSPNVKSRPSKKARTRRFDL